MKGSKVGIVAVAILLVGTGVCFGIAQAGGTHTDRPVLSFEDQEALEQGSSSSPYVENRPVMAFEDSSGPNAETRPVLSFEDQELPQVAKSPSEDMQLESPIETGSLPKEELHGSELPFPVGFVAQSNADLDPFSRSGP
jgi:hypothetical protein